MICWSLVIDPDIDVTWVDFVNVMVGHLSCSFNGIPNAGNTVLSLICRDVDKGVVVNNVKPATTLNIYVPF